MARSRRPSDGPLLFDLPLGEREREEEPQPSPPEAAPEPLFLDQQWPPPPRAEPWGAPEPSPEAASWEPEPAAEGVAARLGDRLKAGLADLAAHVGAALAALVGAELLGARPDLDDLPALALYLAAFSFLYTVVPLAFWGHTPGMAWAGLASRAPGGEPLSFGQTVRRWLAGVATVAALGLPLLLALGGRSLADLLSGSRTYREPD